MALDVGSGAVFRIDELTYDVLDVLINHENENALVVLADKYEEHIIQEALEELDTLKDMGYLFTNDDYTGVNPIGGNVIKAMCLHVAHDCNLRCRYCFADTGEFHMASRCMLSFETGKKAIDFLIANSGNRKHLEIDFFGGEPLMNPVVLKELVKYGRSKEAEFGKIFKFTTTTNALGLNEDMIQFLNKEMENVVISIDGRREVHDYMRPMVDGKGSYDKIMERTKNFIKQRGEDRYYLRGTFTKHNLDFTKDVLHLVGEGFTQLSIEPVVTDERRSYAILESDLERVEEEYETLAKVYLEMRKGDKWFNFFHFNVDLSGGPCLKKRLTGCGAGSEYVAVTPEGDIYPCHQFVGRENMKMGSVVDGTFDESIRKTFANNHVLKKPQCSKCWARFYCSGGCAANAHAFNHDLATPYPMECKLEKKRLECALAIYALEHQN